MTSDQPNPSPSPRAVLVREAHAAEADELGAIFAQALAAKYRPALGSRAETACAALVRRSLTDAAPSVHLVAELDGRIAGAVHLMPGPDSAYPPLLGALAEAVGWARALRAVAVFALLAPGPIAADTAYVDELAVAAWARRQGVAQALLKACAERARAIGRPHLTLMVTADNAAALALYRATGFVTTGRSRWWVRRALFGSPGAITMRWTPPPG